jgi:thiosulfate/3-mercaptopyruvate sulfurtransferase
MFRMVDFRRALTVLALGATALGAQEPQPGVQVSGAWLQEANLSALVTGAWLQARLGDPGILVLDIDSRPDVYDAGHIPGSHFVALSAIPLLGGAGFEPPPTESLEAALEAAGVSDAVHVVIASRSPLSATRLWLTLDYLGHGDHTSILDGGTARWKAEGRPLATGVPAVRRGSLTPRPRPQSIVSADWIAARLDDPGVVLIDARAESEYTSVDGGTAGQASAGHIPGAGHLFWESLIVARETDPSLRSLDALRARFEAVGAGPGRTLVAYCVIGTRASMVYFVGRLLGYDVRLYEGSWHEWAGRDLPRVTGPGRR